MGDRKVNDIERAVEARLCRNTRGSSMFGMTEEQADRQLAEFAAELEPVLQNYIPR